MAATNAPTDDYLAGIVDGEGCIACNMGHGNPHLEVIVEMKDYPVVEMLRQMYPEGGYREAKHNNTKNTYHRWALRGSHAKLFLERVLPHLKLKKSQAEIYLAILDIQAQRAYRYTERQRIAIMLLMEELCLLKKVVHGN